ncbi:MAG: aldo/keto reductase [Propylenella sp.]
MTEVDRRPLGGTGLEVSVLGLGGAPLGDLYERIPEERAIETIETAYDEGLRLFDTSPFYGFGLSEHRFGQVLRRKPRGDFVLSTKIGRILKRPGTGSAERGVFVGGLNFDPVFDYSYDGCMRSIEDSYQRLGLSQIDIALIHDADIWTHGSAEGFERRFREAMDGAYRALDELRSAGIVRAIGTGLNEVEATLRFAKAGDFDCFLLAGRYTLLEQDGLDDLFPLAESKNFSILLGGPFNSGILATGATPGAKYNYRPAPPEIMERVGRIEKVSEAHRVPIAAAAIQFPLGHPRIASIIPGAVSPEEVRRNRELIAHRIPAALWDDLKREGLLLGSAPVPLAAGQL